MVKVARERAVRASLLITLPPMPRPDYTMSTSVRCNKLLKFRVKLKALQGHLVEIQQRGRPSQEQNFMEISLSAYRSRKVSVLDFS